MGNYIKEAKCMFAMDWIATFDFEANELDFLIKLFSNNRYERFKQDDCEPVHRAYSTARFHLEFLPLYSNVRYSCRGILRLIKDFANQQTWRRSETKIVRLE